MPGGRLPLRTVEKSRTAFRTISEVAAAVDVQQHVLRFWETRFPQIEPVKRGGNRRYYRPADVALLHRISRLLYQEGYTIKGVQQLLARDSSSESASESADTSPSLAATSLADAPRPRVAAHSRRVELTVPTALSSLAAIRAQLAGALAAARAL
jgi:DNA-binding transcriptional MerR regulator